MFTTYVLGRMWKRGKEINVVQSQLVMMVLRSTHKACGRAQKPPGKTWAETRGISNEAVVPQLLLK